MNLVLYFGSKFRHLNFEQVHACVLLHSKSSLLHRIPHCCVKRNVMLCSVTSYSLHIYLNHLQIHSFGGDSREQIL